MLDVAESGILRFFLLFIFSKLSYPSALDAADPGGGGLAGIRAASIKRRCTWSSALAVAVPAKRVSEVE
jgi:hypothetical protein